MHDALVEGDPAVDRCVLVSPDESLACLVEPSQLTIVRMPEFNVESEIGIELGSDVAILGNPIRILVLAPSGALYVVNPHGRGGPKEVARLQLERGSRFAALSGSHALVKSASGGVVVSLHEPVSFARIATRIGVSTVASALTQDNFIIEVGGVLEEWSGPLRHPLRRFRLDQPVYAQHVGGSTNQIWFVLRNKLDQITIVPLGGVARLQRIDLPEPAARMVANPVGSMIAVIGADTGALMVVACADGKVTQVQPGPVVDVAWRGTRQLVYFFDGLIRLHDVAASPAEVAKPIQVAKPTEPAEPTEPRSRTDPPSGTPMSTIERVAAWKERARPDHMASELGADAEPELDTTHVVRPAPVLETIVALHQWRDALGAWARASLRGSRGDPPHLAACTLHDVGARLGFDEQDRYVLWLVYGARLCGLDVAPIDLVHLCPNRWDDALGGGRLAALGVLEWRRNRVVLVPEVRAALDELAPLFGTVVPNATNATGRVAIVSAGEPDYAAIGKWAARELGALLVPNARGLQHPARLVLEARARKLAPLLPAHDTSLRATRDGPAVIVVDDPTTASKLELAVALTWPGFDSASDRESVRH